MQIERYNAPIPPADSYILTVMHDMTTGDIKMFPTYEDAKRAFDALDKTDDSIFFAGISARLDATVMELPF